MHESPESSIKKVTRYRGVNPCTDCKSAQ